MGSILYQRHNIEALRAQMPDLMSSEPVAVGGQCEAGDDAVIIKRSGGDVLSFTSTWGFVGGWLSAPPPSPPLTFEFGKIKGKPFVSRALRSPCLVPATGYKTDRGDMMNFGGLALLAGVDACWYGWPGAYRQTFALLSDAQGRPIVLRAQTAAGWLRGESREAIEKCETLAV